MRRLLVVATVLALVGACSYGSSSNRLGDTTSLIVENDNWEDITVYVERAGLRERLGRVTATRQDTLKVPVSMLRGRVSFVLEPFGTRGTRVYGELDDLPRYGSYRYRVRDVPFPIGVSEIRLWIAPRIAQSVIRFWR